jgi:histidinol-phosphate aminotransferase
LIHHTSIDAPALASFLRNRKIIVRYFSSPRIDQYIRITVGTDQQNQLLLEAIAQFLAA